MGGCFASQVELVCLCLCVCSHTDGLDVARESVAQLSGGNGALSRHKVLDCFCECSADEQLAAPKLCHVVEVLIDLYNRLQTAVPVSFLHT